MEGGVRSGEFLDRGGGGFHNIIHFFRAGRGTGTTSLEVKLLQKLRNMS